MGKKSKKQNHSNRSHTEQAHPKKPAGGPPASMMWMMGGGFLVVILLIMFSNRSTGPTTGQQAKTEDAQANAAATKDKAAADTANKAEPKKVEPKTSAKGPSPHSLLAALPSDARTFGGDADKAKRFSDIVTQSADTRQWRAALAASEAFKKDVGTGEGASEAAVLTSFLQLSTRNAAGAAKTAEDALASGATRQSETLKQLGLQAQLDGLPRDTRPSAALITDLEKMAADADSDAVKAAATFHLGRALQKTGDDNAAITRFEQVARAYPDSSEAPAALYTLGNWYQSKDQPSEALEAFENVLKRYPTSPEAKKSREYAGQLKIVGKPGLDVKVTDWINGDPGTLATDLQGKVVVYLFWASWCPHCKKEMPEMMKLYEDRKDDGLVIIGVTNLDNRQDMAKLTGYLNDTGVPFPIAVQDGRDASKYYAVGGIPAAAVVDRKGTIRWRNHPGNNIEDVVNKLLAEAP